jgi:uncharacterized protein YkwD
MASTRWTQVVLSIAAAAMLVSAAGLALAADGHEARALTNCSVSDYSLDSEEMAFLGLINQYRADNGLGALTISTNLNRAAHWMGNDLGVNNYFAHTDSLGRSPYSRAIDCGYPAGAGENLAAGSAWDTAQEAFVAWQNSPGHNANMLGTYYKQIGIARVQVPGSQYTWYWVTNFGATDDGTGGGGQPTNTPTPTNTSVPATATPTKTSVPPTTTNTAVPPTATNTPQGQPTSGATPTNTPVPPSATPTNVAPTATQTTPSGNGGGTPTPPTTPTATPTATHTPASGGNTATPTATKTPTPTATPTKAAATPTATPTATTAAGSLPLVPGSANLVGWPGTESDPETALASIADTIEIVFHWDPETEEWERYGPGLPWYVNSLKELAQGEAYWVIMK